jgi:hypothetical protein
MTTQTEAIKNVEKLLLDLYKECEKLHCRETALKMISETTDVVTELIRDIDELDYR